MEREQDRTQPLGDRGFDQCGGGEGRSIIPDYREIVGIKRMKSYMGARALLYTILLMWNECHSSGSCTAIIV